MNKSVYILAVSLLLMACTHSHDDHAHDDEAVAPDEASKVEVHLVQNQMDVMNIELGTFQPLNLSTTVKASGHLELPPQKRASLSAILGGRVKSILVLEGDLVRKGQTLAWLEHPDVIEMQEEYQQAKSDVGYLEADFKRNERLYKDSIVSTKTFQEARSQYLHAAAQLNAVKAKLQMLHIDLQAVEEGRFFSAIPVRAVIGGYVHSIEINLGKYVRPEEVMFEILDNDHIHIDLMVYEKDMNRVRDGQKVNFSVTNDVETIYEASIFATGKSFEQDPKAMVVHAEIANKKGNLLPGMYVDARIVTDNVRVEALPDDAIVSDGGLNYIFVLQVPQHDHGDGEPHSHGQGEEYVFKKTEVNTGAADIGFTEVHPIDPLPKDAQIVTKGAFYLLAELKKGEGGGGHGHAH